MSAKPTKTTNRLHFSDLDPIRFEDLCLALVYPLHPWNDIRHYGRQGNDRGVDIFAVENLEDGSQRKWIIQCKRYASFSKSNLTNAIDDALRKQAPPDVFLIIVSCDVSRDAHEGYEQYAEEKGIATPLIWTQSILEAKLFSERPDLLFSYFNISQASIARERERRIKRNLAMKHRVQRELLTASVTTYNTQDILKRPNRRFCSSEAIIHSIDDSEYPRASETPDGLISGWFKLEFWDKYYNGIEFIVGIRYAAIRSDDKWAIISYDQELNSDLFTVVKVWHIGRIPFRNIVEIDPDGDEFYPFPHIYCRFAEAGEPYEEHVYCLIDHDYVTLKSNDQMSYNDLISPKSET